MERHIQYQIISNQIYGGNNEGEGFPPPPIPPDSFTGSGMAGSPPPDGR